MTAGATFQQISDSLAARLATISGLRAWSEVPVAANLPMAVVEGFETVSRSTLNACFQWVVVITVYVARADERSAQQKAKALASPGTGGVWNALENEAAADDCDYVIIRELRDFGEYEANGMMLLGFQIVAEVGA